MSEAAIAYDMYGTDYSDAQLIPERGRLSPQSSQDQQTHVGESANNVVYVLPVKVLKNSDHVLRLKTPIPVSLEGQASEYVAMHEASRIAGEGADAKSAIADFYNAFIEVYLAYRDSSDPLSDGGKALLESLNALVQNIEAV